MQECTVKEENKEYNTVWTKLR